MEMHVHAIGFGAAVKVNTSIHVHMYVLEMCTSTPRANVHGRSERPCC